jgi:hypothetical protein
LHKYTKNKNGRQWWIILFQADFYFLEFLYWKYIGFEFRTKRMGSWCYCVSRIVSKIMILLLPPPQWHM